MANRPGGRPASGWAGSRHGGCAARPAGTGWEVSALPPGPARPHPCAARAPARSAADGRPVMRSINGLAGPHWQLGQVASCHAILRGTPARSFTGCASWRTPFACRARGGGGPAPTHPATSPQVTWKASDLYLCPCPWPWLRDSWAVTVRSRLRPFLSRTAVVLASPELPGPEPVDLERYRVRRQARADGTIGGYHLVAWCGRGFRVARVQGERLRGDAAAHPAGAAGRLPEATARTGGRRMTPDGSHVRLEGT
jgi:hypothetical protein